MRAQPKRSKKLPKSPWKKRLVHTFYLVQPMLQFMALIAVMTFLARCSPLASSTDKSAIFKEENPLAAEKIPDSMETPEFVQEDLLLTSLKEVGPLSPIVEIISSDKFADLGRLSLTIEKGESELRVTQLLARRERRNSQQPRPNFLILPLTVEQQVTLAQEGSLRLDLETILENYSESARTALLQRLQKAVEDKNVQAKPYLVAPSAALQNPDLQSLALHLQTYVGFPAGHSPLLEIRATEDELNNHILLAQAFEQGAKLAIVLE